MSSAETAYIGLGSNQGDAVFNICSGFAQLKKIHDTRIINCSSLYRSAPVGYLDQADFVNAVCRLDTDLSATELLQALQEVENRAGRRRDGVRWGPRILDLDLLLYGNAVMQTESLELPHPRMHERAFVLYPLQEIAPAMDIPGRGNINKLVELCASQICSRIDDKC